MLAVKKVGGIARVKREGREPVERRKLARGPFPSIPQLPNDTPRAPVDGKRIHGSRIPPRKIEIAKPGVRCLGAPWKVPLLAFRSSIGRPMPLCLGPKTLACPARIRSCFRVADIQRPVQGKYRVFEHAGAFPVLFIPWPKRGIVHV